MILWYLVVAYPLTTTSIPIDLGPFETQDDCLQRQAAFAPKDIMRPCFSQKVWTPLPEAPIKKR